MMGFAKGSTHPTRIAPRQIYTLPTTPASDRQRTAPAPVAIRNADADASQPAMPERCMANAALNARQDIERNVVVFLCIGFLREARRERQSPERSRHAGE